MLKDLESAIRGSGDLDAVASAADMTAVEGIFLEWAAGHRLSPIIVCRHAPAPFYFALQRGSRELLELDVTEGRWFRGGQLLVTSTLLPLSLVEDDIRMLRPGAQGLVRLLWNGVRYGGRPDRPGLRAERVPELPGRDPSGVEAALGLLGGGRDDGRRRVDAVLAGGWDRRAALRLEARFAGRALRKPAAIPAEAWFRFVQLRSCPLLRVMTSPGRLAPLDPAWWSDVERGHQVIRPDALTAA
jgi:hypothetical protein